MNWSSLVRKIVSSLGTKIILPYALLTLIVAGLGAFVVTNLVTSTLQERFNNQLLDAGRVVSESMVRFEQIRLEVLRAVARTEGVAEGVAAGDVDGLEALVPQLLANSQADVVVVLDAQGEELASWRRVDHQAAEPAELELAWPEFQDVRLVVRGQLDSFGDKQAFLAGESGHRHLFTAGPIYQGDSVVGAVLVGSELREMAVTLTESALARITLYDQDGRVIETTLGVGQLDDVTPFSDPDQHELVLGVLKQSPSRVAIVSAEAEDEVRLGEIEVLNQRYQLAFGDWRLRGRSIGLFSVALPSNFIVSAAATSRNLFNLLFTVVTLAVFALGYVISRRIIEPIGRLMQVSLAVAKGDLEQRSGIRRGDEIGTLAESFDTMTERLASRNRQLVEHASKLQAILNSIADGVLVLDNQERVISSNPAAKRMLAAAPDGFVADLLPELANGNAPAEGTESKGVTPRRYQLGSLVFSARSASVRTPDGQDTGTVVVLRDITRQAEAEMLKDSFVTNVSHELRTPLTTIMGYADLLMLHQREGLSEWQLTAVETIRRGGRQLKRQINKLIELTEIQAGRLSLATRPVPLASVIETLEEEWREPMAEKGLQFEVEMPPSDLTVEADAEHLKWAIENLVSNAHNYTPSGGCVQLRVTRNGHQTRLDISDNGIGIEAADQPYVFDRFFRVKHDLNITTRGVGLGLFITQTIITMHGGRIWLDSKPGAGSTFSFTLPLLDEGGDREDAFDV